MREPERDDDACERRLELRKVRDGMRPSAELASRIDRALRAAEAAGTQQHPARKRRGRSLLLQAPLILPAALGVMIALYVTFDQPSLDTLNVAEHSLEIPPEGKASLGLDLALHHHGDNWTEVAVHAPRGVTVSTRAVGHAEPATCRGNRCRYEFSHKGDSGSPDMQVHVSQPGRYRMEVEHQSRSARVREVIVIHARR